jgi:hypothetical protein
VPNAECSRRASGLAIIMTKKRSERRVPFDHGVPTHIMAIDGTWRRACMMQDASDGGARLIVEGSIRGLNLTEFFLLLSSTGQAYRRCGLGWVKGNQIGAIFLASGMRQGQFCPGQEVASRPDPDPRSEGPASDPAPSRA